jgi:hypothetical protein
MLYLPNHKKILIYRATLLDYRAAVIALAALNYIETAI